MNLENNQSLKESIIVILYKLSGSDHKISDKELKYIFNVGKHIGIDEEEVGLIIMNHQSFSVETPKNEKDRMTILYYLLFLMKADSKIEQSEIKLVKEVSFKLGFRPAMTDELIETVLEHIDSNIPPDELLKTIRKYNN